jgi:hypothetical protein
MGKTVKKGILENEFRKSEKSSDKKLKMKPFHKKERM